MSNPIQRQYLSPNCTLFLQGFADADCDQVLPVMSVLTNAKCQIMGLPELNGGLAFLTNLMTALSTYTQSLLSGLPHPPVTIDTTNSDYIEFEKKDDQNRHRLIIWNGDKVNQEKKVEIELSTIQLFDLQDTIDQLIQDQTTLPQIENPLQPLSRRYRQSEVSLVEQSTPAALGLVSISIVAAIMFIIPHPTKIEDPNLQPQPINNETEVIPSEDESIPSTENEE